MKLKFQTESFRSHCWFQPQERDCGPAGAWPGSGGDLRVMRACWLFVLGLAVLNGTDEGPEERGGGGIFLQAMAAPVRSRILAESLRSSLRSIVHTCQSPWLTANGNSKCKNINIIFASDAALALRNQFPDFFGNSVSESTGTESGRAHSVSHRNCSNGCGKPPSLNDSV